jgi:hypothetical protein
MLPGTPETLIFAAIGGLIGAVANSAYGYLKLSEPFSLDKKFYAKVIIGIVAGIILTHAVLSSNELFTMFLTSVTGGYFGIDVIEMFLKKPEAALEEPPTE